MKGLTQLYPQYKLLPSVKGLYLSENIRADMPIVYANFVSSIDGRIAVRQENESYLPKHLTNENDFRLFLELQAHADCLVTHSDYLRKRLKGKLGDILNIGATPGHEDLKQWRQQQGLADKYTLVVCSKNLDFPEPEARYRENMIIAACQQSPEDRVAMWRAKGYQVLIAGEQMVTGKILIDLLKQYGYQTIFLAAGPKLLTSVIQDGCLDLLYLTISHQLIATDQFHTLIEGNPDYMKHCHLEQTRLIYDASPILLYPQWYVRFQCHYN